MKPILVVMAAAAAFAVAPSTAGAPMPLHLESMRFPNGGEIPAVYTCEGKGASPPLAWTNVPASTRSLSLVVEDPDAPDPKAPTHVVTHWIVYNMAATTRTLAEGAGVGEAALPDVDAEGLNESKKPGHQGMCPPVGRHRYFFRIYALDISLEGLKNPTKADFERAMVGHVLDKAELVGTYEKKAK